MIDHLRETMRYASDELGIGARGLVAMGTGDYADGVLGLSDEPTTPTGSSSTYNAMLVALGLPLAADVVESRDAALAAEMRDLVSSQVTALDAAGWEGRWYQRGFVDSGSPLAPELLFLEPQVLAVLSGLATPARRDMVLDAVEDRLETPLGAVSTLDVSGGSGSGGVDSAQIGGVWPVANAWLTEAYSTRDPTEGWSSFVRNTLATHAELYPDLWYGIWTGPDSTYGPDAARPGEADAHLATALTDYPALNAHVHTSPIRALYGLLGLRGTAAGIEVAPRFPTEDFAVVMPRIAIRSTPASIEIDLVVDETGPLELVVALPSGIDPSMARVAVDGVDTTFASRAGAVAVTVDATAGRRFVVRVE